MFVIINTPNPDFNRVQFEAVRNEAGLNRFVITPTRWIETINAIELIQTPSKKIWYAKIEYPCSSKYGKLVALIQCPYKIL